MEKIKRVSFFFRVFFQIIFIGILIWPVITWLSAPEPVIFAFGSISAVPEVYQKWLMTPLYANVKLLGFIIDLIPTIVGLLALYFLIKLFRLYEQGEIFSLTNVRYIRNVGYGLLIYQLLMPIQQFLLGFVLTWYNPPGFRYAVMAINGTNIGIILTALIIILISWIMAEGCKLREEQQLTI